MAALIFTMKNLFPPSKHTYTVLLYFGLHLASIYIHTKWIYLAYEGLFILYLFWASQFSLRSKNAKGVVWQSAIIHGALTLFYIPELFITRGLSITNPLAALALYPLLHFSLSALVFAFTKKVNHK